MIGWFRNFRQMSYQGRNYKSHWITSTWEHNWIIFIVKHVKSLHTKWNEGDSRLAKYQETQRGTTETRWPPPLRPAIWTCIQILPITRRPLWCCPILPWIDVRRRSRSADEFCLSKTEIEMLNIFPSYFFIYINGGQTTILLTTNQRLSTTVGISFGPLILLYYKSVATLHPPLELEDVASVVDLNGYVIHRGESYPSLSAPDSAGLDVQVRAEDFQRMFIDVCRAGRLEFAVLRCSSKTCFQANLTIKITLYWSGLLK